MAFKSQRQRAYLEKHKPELAARFAKDDDGAELPEKVGHLTAGTGRSRPASRTTSARDVADQLRDDYKP